MNAELDYIHRKISAISHRIDEMSVGFYQAPSAPSGSAPAYTPGQLIELVGLRTELFAIGSCTFAPCDGNTYTF